MHSRKCEIAMRVVVLFFCAATLAYVFLSPYLPRLYPTVTEYPLEVLQPQEDEKPVFRYEVKYGNTTWLLYDPVVPAEEELSIQERAQAAVIEYAREHGTPLPQDFASRIRIVRILN